MDYDKKVLGQQLYALCGSDRNCLRSYHVYIRKENCRTVGGGTSVEASLSLGVTEICNTDRAISVSNKVDRERLVRHLRVLYESSRNAGNKARVVPNKGKRRRDASEIILLAPSLSVTTVLGTSERGTAFQLLYYEPCGNTPGTITMSFPSMLQGMVVIEGKCTEKFAVSIDQEFVGVGRGVGE